MLQPTKTRIKPLIINLMHVYAVACIYIKIVSPGTESRFPIQNFYLEPVGRNTVIICAFELH
jgi:hypothetical protein